MPASARSATTSKSVTPSMELFKQYAQPWKPHLGQKRGMKFLIEHAAGIMAADPGVGKTAMVYGAFKVLRAKKLASKMLVVAPLKVCYLVWPKEQEKWSDFAGLKVVVLHDKTKDFSLIEDADVCVINPEGLDWLLGAERTKGGRGRVSVTTNTRRFASFGFDTLVLDELTRFKNSQSGRFKVLKTVLQTFGRRWGLTGSLVANGLLDLFGQCYCMDMGRTLGQFVTHYRMTYFNQSAYDRFTWTLKEGAAESIYERLNPLVLRLAAEDYVDMPMLQDVMHVFDLPPKVRAIYDTLEEDLIAKLEDGTILAANAAAASIKCRQVANGGIYLDPEVEPTLGTLAKGARKWANLHTEKVDILESLIEELQGAPLLVAYDFEHDLDRLKIKFGNDVPYIGGGTSAKRFKELEGAWNAGELPLLLGHPQSVAHGLNLQAAGNHVAWHSMTYNYELYDQFIRRIRRQGSKANRIFNHLILAKDTVDMLMLYAVRRKEKGQGSLYQALKDMRAARK